MTLLVKNIFTLLKILVDNTRPKQITFGLLVGLGLGLSPTVSLQTIFLLMCLLVFNIQFSLAIASSFFFKGLFSFFSSVFHQLGIWFLTLPDLKSIFVKMYDVPFVPYTNFNNTIVMGSFIFYILISPFAYFLILFLVKKYQERIVNKFKKTKIYHILKATFIVKWYEKYDRIYR